MIGSSCVDVVCLRPSEDVRREDVREQLCLSDPTAGIQSWERANTWVMVIECLYVRSCGHRESTNAVPAAAYRGSTLSGDLRTATGVHTRRQITSGPELPIIMSGLSPRGRPRPIIMHAWTVRVH